MAETPEAFFSTQMLVICGIVITIPSTPTKYTSWSMKRLSLSGWGYGSSFSCTLFLLFKWWAACPSCTILFPFPGSLGVLVPALYFQVFFLQPVKGFEEHLGDLDVVY